MEVIDYSAEGETVSQHPGWSNVMSDVPRVPR